MSKIYPITMSILISENYINGGKYCNYILGHSVLGKVKLSEGWASLTLYWNLFILFHSFILILHSIINIKDCKLLDIR